jgi:integrase
MRGGGGGMSRRKKSRVRTLRLGPEQMALLERQREQFRQKFGREPGPDDPIFFDPKADDPRPLDPDWLVGTVAAAMEQAGIDPAKIHAYRRTGMLLTRDNYGQWSAEDLAEWQAALDEYEALAARRN